MRQAADSVLAIGCAMAVASIALGMLSVMAGCFTTPVVETRPFNAPLESESNACAVYQHGMPRCSCARIGGRGALTAAHCVPGDAADYRVGRREVVAIARMVALDTAYLELAGESDGVLPVRTSALSSGRWMLGFGCAWSGGRDARFRQVEPIGPASDDGRWMYRGDVCGGDSGSGVWDETGALAGVVVAKGEDRIVYVSGVYP